MQQPVVEKCKNYLRVTRFLEKANPPPGDGIRWGKKAPCPATVGPQVPLVLLDGSHNALGEQLEVVG